MTKEEIIEIGREFNKGAESRQPEIDELVNILQAVTENLGYYYEGSLYKDAKKLIKKYRNNK